MASPDFSNYIDLTLFDTTANTIYNDAVEYAKTSFPEFSPRVGTVENAILEAFAHASFNLTSTINRLPDGLMEGLLKLMGFSRIEATPASGVIEIEVTINTGVTISAGTIVSYDVFDTGGVLTQYLFETTEDLTIASGNTSGTVNVVAVATEEYPDIPVPQSLTLVSTTPYVFQVELQSLSTVGTNTESDEEYFNRAVRYLASLSTAIVTANQMTNYVSVTYPTVSRFKVYDLTDSSDMDFTAADAAGEVTVALCDSAGDPIETEQKAIIQSDIESRVVAGLNINLYDMQTFDVDVTATVVVESNYSTATVSLAVSEAIENYLSISGWDWQQGISQQRLSAIASRVPGVSYIMSASSSLPTSVPDLATESAGDITILEKGAIPIGSCTTTAV
jgi:hypothetical protein